MKVTSDVSQANLPTQDSPFPIIRKKDWEIELRADQFCLKRFAGGKCISDITTPFCIIETDQMSDEGVKEKFTNASPREVHVDSHEGQIYVRFGSYGLAGGAPGDEDSSGWNTLARGAVYTGFAAGGTYGIYKLGTGETLKGAAALGASLSGAASLYQGDSALQCAGKTALGAGLGAGASVASSYLPQHLGGDLKAQVYAQALVGGTSGAVDTVGRTIIDEQRLPSMKEVGKGAACGAASAGAGTLAAAGAHACIPTNAAEGALGASSRMTKAFLTSATGAGTGTVAANGTRCLIEGKELNRGSLFNGAFEAALMSGTIGAAVSGVEEYYRYQDYQDLLDKKAKLKEAETEAAKKKAELDQANQECEQAQQEVERLEQELKVLEAAEVELTRIKKEIAQLEKDLAQLEREIGGEIDNATRSKEEALKKYQELKAKREALATERDKRSEELTLKQKRLEEAKRNLENKKVARAEAEACHKKAVSEKERSERIQEAQTRIRIGLKDEKYYLNEAELHKKRILDKIKKMFAEGYKAKIGGKYYKDPVEDSIRVLEKVLQGKFPLWKKGQNRIAGSRIDWSPKRKPPFFGRNDESRDRSIRKHLRKYKNCMWRVKYAREDISYWTEKLNAAQGPTLEQAEKSLQQAEKSLESATNEVNESAVESNVADKREKRAEKSLESATNEVNESAGECGETSKRAEKVEQEGRKRIEQEGVPIQRKIEQKRGTVPGLEKQLEQKPIVEQQLGENKGRVTKLETSTIPEAQAGFETAERNRAERASSYQEKTETHATKYPEVPDFRYLSLNSLLGPSKEAEERRPV